MLELLDSIIFLGWHMVKYFHAVTMMVRTVGLKYNFKRPMILICLVKENLCLLGNMGMAHVFFDSIFTVIVGSPIILLCIIP